MPVNIATPKPIANCHCNPPHFYVDLENEEVPVMIGLAGDVLWWADGTHGLTASQEQEAHDCESAYCPQCGQEVDWE